MEKLCMHNNVKRSTDRDLSHNNMVGNLHIQGMFLSTEQLRGEVATGKREEVEMSGLRREKQAEKTREGLVRG